MSWSELDAFTNRVPACWPVGRGGFSDDRLPTSVAFVESMLAAPKLGAVPQPVSSRLPVGELTRIVELAQPKLVVGFDAASSLRRESDRGQTCIPHDGEIRARKAPIRPGRRY